MAMKRVGLLTALTFAFMVVLVAAPHSVQAFSETRDPFVADPIGPYRLINNPASVMETDALTVRAALGHGFTTAGDDGTQLIAYMEPDMGLGAGALSWHGTNLPNGSKRRELGYTIARSIANAVYYGVTLKYVQEDEISRWAADLGIMTTDASRLRAGLVMHNLIGQSAINPTHVTGSLSYALTNNMGVSLSLASPSLSDSNRMNVGVALDVDAPFGTRVRLGRITNFSTMEGYWLGAVQADIDTITLDATVMVDDDWNRRVAIGLMYRF